MIDLYNLKIEQINTWFLIDDNEDEIVVRGRIYLNENDITRSFIYELLKRTRLNSIIKDQIISTINENIEKVIPFMLSNNNEEKRIYYDIHVYPDEDEQDRKIIAFGLWEPLDTICINFIKNIKRAHVTI